MEKLETNVARERIDALLDKALRLLPKARPAALPPTRDIPDVPEWHDVELRLWAIGEDIRQELNGKTSLRGDVALYKRIFQVVSDRRGMRGRQSFALLFAYRPCLPWAERLAGLLPDEDGDIDGHVLSALNKMKAAGFSQVVNLYVKSPVAWVRREARRYLEKEQHLRR